VQAPRPASVIGTRRALQASVERDAPKFRS